jgi:hypothetical protein
VLDLLTSQEQRFFEILVRALTQGIEVHGERSVYGGISLAGRRVVVFMFEDHADQPLPERTPARTLKRWVVVNSEPPIHQ